MYQVLILPTLATKRMTRTSIKNTAKVEVYRSAEISLKRQSGYIRDIETTATRLRLKYHGAQSQGALFEHGSKHKLVERSHEQFTKRPVSLLNTE